MGNGRTARGKPEKPPLDDPPIKVTVTPKKTGDATQDKQNREYADKKVAPQIEKEVREAVEQAKPDGRQAQRQAQKDAGDKAAQQIPDQKVEEIKINVQGHETKHKPSEGGPPVQGPVPPAPSPPPPPPKKT